MKFKIIENSDEVFVRQVKQDIKDKGGYCPCSLLRTKETKCICEEFRLQETEGPCGCGLYIKIKER